MAKRKRAIAESNNIMTCSRKMIWWWFTNIKLITYIEQNYKLFIWFYQPVCWVLHINVCNSNASIHIYISSVKHLQFSIHHASVQSYNILAKLFSVSHLKNIQVLYCVMWLPFKFLEIKGFKNHTKSKPSQFIKNPKQTFFYKESENQKVVKRKSDQVDWATQEIYCTCIMIFL